MKETILKLDNIHKKYADVSVLKGISLEIKQGEIVAITGKSGEGKSTLLHIIGTLEKPCQGTLEICSKIPMDSSLHQLRNEHIGFIFQTYNLLDEYSVLENLLMPQRIARKNCSKESPSYKRAILLLEEVQLSSKIDTLTKFLSGGEKQRIAIARALCNDPDLILADEPTGNLDGENSERVQRLLIESAKKRNKTLIIATHDQELAKQCDRTLLLKDGLFYTAN
ncbi:MAG TPA: ABC transporter ATP-binding protein [Rhabdochlamydiaceae bacterium]|nr:ABC transporter ATP-binding protein [Rhabdochlamydiaceae bacterium]